MQIGVGVSDSVKRNVLFLTFNHRLTAFVLAT